jgi:hypothetical protein
MIDIRIPGFGQVALEHLVLDFNGTLACDGVLSDGVRALLVRLSRDLEITSSRRTPTAMRPPHARACPAGWSSCPKGPGRFEAGLCADAGHGTDGLHRQRPKRPAHGPRAAIGVCVIGEEGASAGTAAAAHVVCRSAGEALSLLIHTRRLVATLRS